jgi:hypothetical protein
MAHLVHNIAPLALTACQLTRSLWSAYADCQEKVL